MSTTALLLLAMIAAPTGVQEKRLEMTPDLSETQPGEERRQTLQDLVVVSPRPPQRWQGRRISLSTKDADLVEVLRTFARLADVNLVLAPGVEGKVTVELHDVPWDQALYVILQTHGLAAELDGRIWGVGPVR